MRPTGEINLLEGTVYKTARADAKNINQSLRAFDARYYGGILRGKQIHEIIPVKFGGSPTDLANKIPLPTAVHRQVNTWFKALQRLIEG